MSYAATAALQAAVYGVLRQDGPLAELIGDAVYDAMPVSAPAGTYVALGPEDVRDAGDYTAPGAAHEFVVSVLSGSDAGEGFRAVKEAAAAVSDALENTEMTLGRGHLAGLWFLRAKAQRNENGAGRRVDMTFRARIDLA